jgi:hypothetical protein
MFPAVVDATLAGARAADARLVFVDDTWMYGRVSAPMTEELPYRPVSDKGVLRAWLAERVLAAHARGDVRTVIGRGPELYGPAVESVLGRNLFGQAVADRRAFWVGAMDQPLAPLFIDDFAHGLAELGEHEQALGQVWHLPTPPPVTARRFVDLIAAEVGRPLALTPLDERVIRTLGLVWPVARHGAEMLYQFRRPHSVDASKYLSSFGPGQVTSFELGSHAPSTGTAGPAPGGSPHWAGKPAISLARCGSLNCRVARRPPPVGHPPRSGATLRSVYGSAGRGMAQASHGQPTTARPSCVRAHGHRFRSRSPASSRTQPPVP